MKYYSIALKWNESKKKFFLFFCIITEIHYFYLITLETQLIFYMKIVNKRCFDNLILCNYNLNNSLKALINFVFLFFFSFPLNNSIRKSNWLCTKFCKYICRYCHKSLSAIEIWRIVHFMFITKMNKWIIMKDCIVCSG